MPGLTGETVGEADGEATGVAGAIGAGVFGTLGLGSQAPNTAVDTAKTVVNIMVLLIVFSPWPSLMVGLLTNTDPNCPLADIRSRTEKRAVLSRFAVRSDKNFAARHRSISTLRADERMRGGNLQQILFTRIEREFLLKNESTKI